VKVLITGATGRMGTHLAARLTDGGHTVVALVMPGDPFVDRIAGYAERVVTGAIRNTDALSAAVDGVDAICHLASTLITRGHGDRESFDTILGGTFDLLNTARERGAALQRFVAVSTAGVYIGDRLAGPRFLPVDETHPIGTSNVYSASKLGAEHLTLTFWRAYGIPAAIVRPTDTAEPWEFVDKASFLGKRFFLSGHLARLAQPPASEAEAALGRELKRLIPGGEQVVTLRHPGGPARMITLNDARDAAAGIALVLESPNAVGEVFNIGPAESYPEDEVGRHLATRLGMEHHSIETPLLPDWTFGSLKAQSVLGYRPQHTVFDMIDEAVPGADPAELRSLSSAAGKTS